MAGEWPVLPLEECMSAIIDYRGKTPVKTASGVPLITAKIIKGGRIEMPEEFIDPADYDEWMRRGIPEAGDVVLTTEAPLGEVAQLDGSKVALAQRVITLRGKAGVLDNTFLKFLLQSKGIQEQLHGRSTGTTVHGIRQSELRKVLLPVPAFCEQRAIAHILGTLDDKIELNRRMNETLEAMARALFKSWFVDFDPVRAKMNLPSPSGRGVGGEGTSPAKRTNAPIPTALLDFARQLRRQSTDAETLLWRLLRGRQIANAKFRRQHSFPPYILDFYCHELKLAVELDGGQHNEEAGRQRDARRDAYLAEHGIRVLRFWNNDVLRETEAVLEAIYSAVVGRSNGVPSPPTPLPEGEGSFGLPKPLADLFPARLVDSELGEIPEGWRIKSVGDLADVAGGTTPSTKEPSYWEGGMHAWATPKDLSGLSVPILLDTERRITDAGLSQVGSGLLPEGTVLLSSRAPIGYLAVAELPVAINQGFIAMVAKAGTSNLFLLLWASVAHEDIVSRANGSTFLEISKANFRPIPVVTPPAQVMQAFEKLARPLYERIVRSARESRTLAALRDTLLPKLISGEIRVKDAERFIKATP